MPGNLIGRLGRLGGQGFHFTGHDGKALACAPARAASMVAFKASKFVWLAMALINCTTLPTRSARRGHVADPGVGCRGLPDRLLHRMRGAGDLLADLGDAC